MATISITGATGFIGLHLIKFLSRNNFPVQALVRKNSSSLKNLSDLSVKICEVDYQSVNSLLAGIKGSDVLIHALGGINGSASKLREANVMITQRVIEAARAAPISKFILISSVAALQRHGAYGQTKFEAEEIVRKSGIPFVILRPSYVYGKGDRNNTALIINTLRFLPVVPVLGGDSVKLQPLFIDDLCRFVLGAVNRTEVNWSSILAGPQIPLKKMLKIFADGMRQKRFFLDIPLKPVQKIVQFFSCCFPNTSLPVKQFLELDKHEAFSCDAFTDFNFTPTPITEGVHKMFAFQNA